MSAAVGLAERLENNLLLLRRNANSAVLYGKGDLAPRNRRDPQGNGAPLGEFERVGEQIFQDLAESLRLRLQPLRRSRIHGKGERQAPLPRQWLEAAAQGLHGVIDADGLRLHFHLSGFDL